MNYGEVMNNNYHAKNAYQNDKIASKYDENRFTNIKGKLTNYLEKNAIYKAMKSIPDNSKVLDVPCGTGRATEWLLQKGFRVTAFDISEEMISQAKNKLNRYSNIEQFYVGDAENSNLDDNAFDCVVSVRLMGHIPPEVRIKMLNEFKRLSKNYVVVTYYHAFSIQRYLRRFIDIFSKEKRSMWFPVSKKEMMLELNESGLKVVSIYPIMKFISETWVVLAKKI